MVCVYSGRSKDSGVVSTANYAARELGVKSGIPIILAKNRLVGVQAKFIPMRREKYESYSKRIISLVKGEADVVEQTGIDEAFFDITKRTGGDFGLAEDFASRMKHEVFQREKLTCSIGLGPNKVVAKLASDYRKPDGLTVVRPERVRSFMDPLPVDKLCGVGTKSSAMLQAKGIITISDLSKADLSILERMFGRKPAVLLHNVSNGLDEERVTDKAKASQVSRIVTLKKDSRNVDEILTQLAPTFEDIQRKLMQRTLLFRSLSVIGVLPNLAVRTRTKTLERPTDELSAIRDNVPALLSLLIGDSGQLRRVGIKVADLTEPGSQSSLVEFMR